MRKRAHSETEMVRAVKELEGGMPAEQVARGHDVWTNSH